MTGGDLHRRLAATLAAAGCRTMFALPGGGPNLDVVGAATDHGIDVVLAHTETAAAIMAGTHGVLTGSPGAVVVTRGPGAASVVNGLAQATLDRFPLVAVTDTVPSATAGRVAHQRLDQRTMLGTAAKVSATITDGTTDDELAALVAAATGWPRGGVHLDYDPGAPSSPPPGRGSPSAASTGVVGSQAGTDSTVDATGAGMASAAARLAAARTPVVIVGVEAAVTAPGLGPVLAAAGLPVLSTYQAIGLVPTESDVAAGLFTNGASERPLLEAADLIVTIGLDTVEPIPAPWTYRADVVRLSAVADVDAYLPAAIEVIGDLTALTTELLGAVDGHATDWSPEAGAIHREEVRRALGRGGPPEPSGFGPLELVTGLTHHSGRVGTVTVDAGAHFLAIMPLWPVIEPQRLLISNGLATMGFALPAAIGAATARPGEPVLALTGDGGLSMVLGELETLARRSLPVTVVVFDDAALSLIEIKQRPDQGGPEAVRFAPVDYGAVARGFGLQAVLVTSIDELDAALADQEAWKRPRVIDARIDPAPYGHLLQVTRG